MISKWKVRTVDVAGSTFYQVYRTTDASRAKDRIETRGGYWTTEAEATALAEKYNKEGE